MGLDQSVRHEDQQETDPHNTHTGNEEDHDDDGHVKISFVNAVVPRFDHLHLDPRTLLLYFLLNILHFQPLLGADCVCLVAEFPVLILPQETVLHPVAEQGAAPGNI